MLHPEKICLDTLHPVGKCPDTPRPEGRCRGTHRPGADYLARLRPKRLDVSDVYIASRRSPCIRTQNFFPGACSDSKRHEISTRSQTEPTLPKRWWILPILVVGSGHWSTNRNKRKKTFGSYRSYVESRSNELTDESGTLKRPTIR